jgi:hypothetical protein
MQSKHNLFKYSLKEAIRQAFEVNWQASALHGISK